ncbi:MAG TPA: MATE family efflux transporter [Candidatus Limnocylindria bacterium]|nr:MATE family efflux transporter [Candidatus Limnocylindria bacterium]
MSASLTTEIRSRPAAADFQALFRLAVPVVLAQVGLMAMNVVDTMIVGRVSATALAGVAIGTVCVFAIGTFGMGVLMSLDPIVSQAVGAGDDPAIARALQRGVVLAGALGVVGALALIPAEPVLRALGQRPELVAVAVPYVHVQIPSLLVFFLTVAFRQTLQALGHMRPIVVTVVVMNVVNGLLAWAFVFGELGAPRLGAMGAGLATTIARWLMGIMLLILGWRDLEPRLRWRPDSIRWRPIGRMIRIGLPIGFQYELEFGVFAAVALIMGRLGPVPASAHQIAINIASLTFMVPLGVSSAAAVLVGRAVGAGDAGAARRAGLASLAAGAGFMTLSAIVLALAPQLLARAYTPDPAVLALAVTLIPIAGVFQVFDGTQVVSIGVLRGVGDTRTPLLVNLLGYWAFAFPLGLWLGFGIGWGPQGLWWGLVAGLMVVAIVLIARVRNRLWQPIDRILVDEGAVIAAPAE